MTIGLLFWILMIFWVVFGLWSTWPNYKASGGNLLLFILLALLGWATFGPALHR